MEGMAPISPFDLPIVGSHQVGFLCAILSHPTIKGGIYLVNIFIKNLLFLGFSSLIPLFITLSIGLLNPYMNLEQVIFCFGWLFGNITMIFFQFILLRRLIFTKKNGVNKHMGGIKL